MFSLICAWINDWVNNLEAGDLRRNHAHYDVIVMLTHNAFDVFTDIQIALTAVVKTLQNTEACQTVQCIHRFSFVQMEQNNYKLITKSWIIPCRLKLVSQHIHHYRHIYENVDRLVKKRRNSSALAMELRLSCIKPSICPLVLWNQIITHVDGPNHATICRMNYAWKLTYPFMRVAYTLIISEIEGWTLVHQSTR